MYRGVARLGGARCLKQVWRPVFEPELFRKQMYCIEESACDIFGRFGARGIALARYPPDMQCDYILMLCFLLEQSKAYHICMILWE